MLSATQKAAILVANLDRHTADLLLDQMSPQQAAAVRRAVIELDDLDPALATDVLDEFCRLNGGAPPKKRAAGSDVTWEPSGEKFDEPVDEVLTASGNVSHRPEAADDPAAASRFRSLRQADPSEVSRYLRAEHPQTIAVVLSHLPAEQSADVLARLPAELQVDVIRRLADLEETDPQVLLDIEASIEAWMVDRDRYSRRRRAGDDAVRRILASAELGVKDEMLANLLQRDQSLAERLGAKPPTAITAPVPEVSASNSPSIVPPPDVPVFHVTEIESPASPAVSRPSVAERRDFTGDPGARYDEPWPRFEFDDLDRLDDDALAAVFARATPQVVRLALAGAGPRMVERVLTPLSAAERRRFRRSLDELRPLRVDDVRTSQQRLADLAARMIRDREPTT